METPRLRNSDILRRTWSDTLETIGLPRFGRPVALFMASAIVGFAFLGWLAGPEAVKEEVLTFLAFSMLGPGLVFLAIIIWNFAFAADRIILEAIYRDVGSKDRRPPVPNATGGRLKLRISTIDGKLHHAIDDPNDVVSGSSYNYAESPLLAEGAPFVNSAGVPGDDQSLLLIDLPITVARELMLVENRMFMAVNVVRDAE